MSIGRLPRPSGTGCGRSRRTSDSKSPPGPGAKFPVIVHRKHDRLRRRRRFGGHSDHAGASALAAVRSLSLIGKPSPALRPNSKRRNDAGDVVGIRVEQSWTHQSRQRKRRRAVERAAYLRRTAVARGRLRVRPRPAVAQIGQLDRGYRRCRDLQRRARRVDGRCPASRHPACAPRPGTATAAVARSRSPAPA